MNQPEQRFWAKIKGLIPGHVQRLDATVNPGVPDVNVCCCGTEAWFELKVWTAGVGILLRKEQWAWHSRRIAHGNTNCWVLCYVEDSDLIIVMKTQDIKVEAYGTQGKYVRVTNCSADWAFTIPKREFKQFLKINIFPKDLS